MASLWSTYAFRQQELAGWKVGAGVNWRAAAMSARTSNAAPQQSYTPAYSVLNAMAEYSFKFGTKKWSAQININTVLNDKHWSVYHAPAGGVAYINYGDPRSVLASLKLEL